MSVINSFLKKVFGPVEITTQIDDFRPLLIGTHHKAGTNWLSAIFREISDRHNLALVEGDQPEDLSAADVFFQNHSHLDFQNLGSQYRGVHMIRDPRDVIISACFYHQKSEEEWLHIKRRCFGGMSYQEKLNSLPSFDDQLIFEMEHISLITVKDMWCWDYHNPAFFEVKYEQLIADTEMLIFRELFIFLGFSGHMLEDAINIAYSHCLFSGNVTNTDHVRSGKPAQWLEYFKNTHNQRFLELFGDVLVDLGYEPDHSWAGLDESLESSGLGECLLYDIFDVLYHPDDPESNLAISPITPEDDPHVLFVGLQKQIKNRDREIDYFRRILRRKNIV